MCECSWYFSTWRWQRHYPYLTIPLTRIQSLTVDTGSFFAFPKFLFSLSLLDTRRHLLRSKLMRRSFYRTTKNSRELCDERTDDVFFCHMFVQTGRCKSLFGGRHFHMGLCLQTGSAKDECDQHLVQRRARGRKSCEYSSEQCFYYIFYDNDNPRGVSIDERQGGGSRRR